jgi:hypothetical protein
VATKPPPANNNSFGKVVTQMTGGKVTVEKYGKDHMARIGRLGYEKAKARLAEQGRDFHSEGGRASWANANGQAILNGEFQNQSLAMWGYSTKLVKGQLKVVKESFEDHLDSI